MKNSYNNYGLCKYLGIVTGKQFEDAYNDMARSADKRPVASTLIPVTEAQGGTNYMVDPAGNNMDEPLLQAWIFYEHKEQDNRTITPQGTVQKQPQVMI